MSFQGHDVDGMLDASNVPDILLHDGRFLSNARLKTETISIFVYTVVSMRSSVYHEIMYDSSFSIPRRLQSFSSAEKGSKGV